MREVAIPSPLYAFQDSISERLRDLAMQSEAAGHRGCVHGPAPAASAGLSCASTPIVILSQDSYKVLGKRQGIGYYPLFM